MSAPLRFEIVDGMGPYGTEFAILDNLKAEHLDARYDTRTEAQAALRAMTNASEPPLRFEDVPGYSMRVVRVFDGPGPVPLATLSINGKSIIARPGVAEDVIVQAALWLADHPEPGQ